MFSDFINKKKSIAVVGLGYVGLPLAIALSRYFTVFGFDISQKRISELSTGFDRTGEVLAEDIINSSVSFTTDPCMLKNTSIIIIAVPTPIDSHRSPDLTFIQKASAIVGAALGKGSIVVYESTVYPGVTEDICVPILEKTSGLMFGRDFEVGYSPERINPGDKVHTVENIIKVVSASTLQTSFLLSEIYGTIVKAGIHIASSIKVAEAAKVIENTQRDLNIALMNELALIFDKLDIDTLEVLEAAETKWNFLPFRPGLVGGHCIGIDPYYLTYKAEEIGYHPQVILAGRRINDSMGKFIAEKTIKMLIAKDCRIGNARVGILGFTFKENVPDLRNTRVIDICHELAEYGASLLIHDPLADADEAQKEYGVSLVPFDNMRELDALIVAVGHDEFKNLSLDDLRLRFAIPDNAVLLDIKGLWSHDNAIAAGFSHWRL